MMQGSGHSFGGFYLTSNLPRCTLLHFSKSCVPQGWEFAFLNKTPENKEEEERCLAGEYQLDSMLVSPFSSCQSLLQVL